MMFDGYGFVLLRTLALQWYFPGRFILSVAVISTIWNLPMSVHLPVRAFFSHPVNLPAPIGKSWCDL